MESIEDLLKKEKVIYLIQKKEVFFGMYINDIQEIKDDIIRYKHLEYDIDKIISILKSKYFLCRWSFKEKLIDDGITKYEIYKFRSIPKIYLLVNKTDNTIILKILGDLDKIKLINPTYKTLEELLQEYDISNDKNKNDWWNIVGIYPV